MNGSQKSTSFAERVTGANRWTTHPPDLPGYYGCSSDRKYKYYLEDHQDSILGPVAQYVSTLPLSYTPLIRGD